MIRNLILPGCVVLLLITGSTVQVQAELLGYWSADSTGGSGTAIPDDNGNAALTGTLMGAATYSASGQGHTGQAGDYALSFPGTDTDIGTLPPTGAVLEQATVTAWVKGHQTGDWAGLVLSRDAVEPIGIDIRAGSGQLTYIWNNNAADSWGFASGLDIPADEWAFVALTVEPDAATLYVGPQGGSLNSASNSVPHVPQTNTAPWDLSDDTCCDGRNFAGLIDDVAIWNEALSPAQLAALHSGAATPLTIPEPSTLVLACLAFVCLWRRRY